jgi:hypothetical protein
MTRVLLAAIGLAKVVGRLKTHRRSARTGER